MSDNLIDFTWSVHHTGYSWSNRLPLWDGNEPLPEGPYLVSGDLFALGGYADTDEYRPLDDRRALFWAFTQIPTTPPPSLEAIRSFANQYGRLGIGRVRVPTSEDYTPDSMRFTHGEPYSEWITHIKTMRAVLKLWQTVKSEGLWKAEKVQEIAIDLVASSDDSVTRFVMEELTGKKPSRRDAEDALFSVINVQLRDHGAMRVEFDLLHIMSRGDDGFSDEGNNGDEIEQPGFTPRLRVAPRSLLGALWFQLARAVAGNIAFKVCRQCDTWFEVDHSSTRASREFCSESCRSRSYRERIVSAQELHARGESMSSIADQLGSTEVTVAGWIKRKVR